MNYIDIKIGNERYIQRSEFSKITIINDNGSTYFISNLEELPPFQQTIIKSALEVEKEPEKYFEYKESMKDSHSIVITEYLGNLTHIIIPREINGKKVIGIETIFMNNEKVEALILPDDIKEIPRHFCNKALNLKFVQLPSKLKNIPVEAFAQCKNLKHINLENIKNIGAYGFYGCGHLENVNLENVKTISPFGFSYCSSLHTIDIPNIEDLCANAFGYCHNLKTIFLGDNLTKINDQTFTHCTELENIKLPNNLNEIDRYAFFCCKSLLSIDLPESLRTIKEGVFHDTGLSGTLNLPKKLTSIGPTAFFTGNLKEVNISKNTKYKINSFYLPYVSINKYEEKRKENPIIEEER